MLGVPSTFVTPTGVLNLTTLCQSSPSVVLGTWCANPNHINFAFPYTLSNLNSIIILCLDPVPHPSTHLCEVFTFSIILHCFPTVMLFLSLAASNSYSLSPPLAASRLLCELAQTQIFSLVFPRLLKPSSTPFVVVKLFDLTRVGLLQSS